MQDWASQLHLLADFDKTLTKAYTDWKDTGSLISILRNGNYLSQQYTKAAQEYYAHYSVIERSLDLPLEEKTSAMQEWREKHLQLFVDEGLQKKHIYQAMQSDIVTFREGYQKFFDQLSSYGIPLVILSAGGLGILSIQKFFENHHLLSENIHIVGNDFIRNDAGVAIGFKEPIIHSLNKSETVMKIFPFYEEIVERKNVILLGDNLGDVQMIEGFSYQNLLKIWFLNKDIEQQQMAYMDAYDIVIFGDGDLSKVNEILSQIVS